MPQPWLLWGRWRSVQLFLSRTFTSFGVSEGYFDRSRAMLPLTIGVAMEVPLFLTYAVRAAYWWQQLVI